jgi:hypothetical protein
VARDEVLLDGRGLGGGEDLGALAPRVAQDLRMAARLAGADRIHVALWLAPDLPLDVLDRLLSEVEVVADVWWREGEVPPPAADPLAAQARRAEAFAGATRGCSAARIWLPRDGRPGAPAALVDALAGCGCDGLDLTAVEEAASSLLAPRGGGLRRAPVSMRLHGTVDPEETILVLDDPGATAASLPSQLVGRGVGTIPVEVR